MSGDRVRGEGTGSPAETAQGSTRDTAAGTTARGGLTRRSVLGSVGTAAGVALAGVTPGGAAPADGPTGLAGRSWERTWSDEFEGNSIDDSVWTFRTGGGCGENGQLGACNWGNNEAQYYTDGDNAHIEDGTLIIEAREEQYTGAGGTYDYTSSRMVTDGKVSKQYGRIDVRAKVPIGQGIWPAIWMLPEGHWTWPNDGEIDIMELVGHQPATIHGTCHGGGYAGADGISGSYTLNEGTFNDAFHVFSIVWDPDRIQWFVDGTKYHEATKQQVQRMGHTWPFDDSRFHVILNVAVGGSWPGYPDETTDFPKQLAVDYVRFFDEVKEPTGPPAVEGGARPTDPDDDGHYEDLNGNGGTDFDDVVTYFQHMEEPAITDYTQYYDYNDNDDIDYADLVDLFEAVR